MMTSKSVWHVGGEDVRMRIPLLLSLQDKGFSVGAIGTEDPEIFEKHNIPYRRYELHRWIGPFSDLQSYQQLKQIFTEVKPDIVHGFDTKPAILTPLAAQNINGVNAVRTITGMGYIFSSDSFKAKLIKPFYRFLQKIASSEANKTIFQNPDDLNYFKGTGLINADKQALIRGSGIDINKFLQRQISQERLEGLKLDLNCQDKVVFTMVSRLVKDKGVLEYLEAARVIKQQRDDVTFLLVGPTAGEGKEAVSLEKINEYSDCVNYLGRRSDIPDVLAISDVFTLPSYYREGLPRVLLEACCAQLPIITTDMPGCKEVVQHGKNGLVVKIRDADDLADKMKILLNTDASQRVVMGKLSRELVEQEFTLEKVTQAYADIYNKILGGQ